MREHLLLVGLYWFSTWVLAGKTREKIRKRDLLLKLQNGNKNGGYECTRAIIGPYVSIYDVTERGESVRLRVESP